jgi:hypothetical protein
MGWHKNKEWFLKMLTLEITIILSTFTVEKYFYLK